MPRRSAALCAAPEFGHFELGWVWGSESSGGSRTSRLRDPPCHLEPGGTPEEQAPVRNGYRYLDHRRDYLDYPRAVALGLPIGSGMIESGHRPVLQARLKKAGTAWLPDQIAHLCVLRANRLWASLWN